MDLEIDARFVREFQSPMSCNEADEPAFEALTARTILRLRKDMKLPTTAPPTNLFYFTSTLNVLVGRLKQPQIRFKISGRRGSLIAVSD